jgi:hypothetical protein
VKDAQLAYGLWVLADGEGKELARGRGLPTQEFVRQHPTACGLFLGASYCDMLIDQVIKELAQARA